MIAKQDRKQTEGRYSASSRYLYIILVSVQLLSSSTGALADMGTTAPAEPHLYTVTKQEETQLSSDRFFGVRVDGVQHQQFCLFRPIKLASYDSGGPSSISIYAIGHNETTDRVFGPQFLLKNRTALWMMLLAIAVIAGCFSQRILRKLELDVKNRMAGFALTVLAAFLILVIGKGCLGGLASIPVNSSGELVDGATLCVDNATGKRVQIYLDGRFHAVVPGGHHLIMSPAKTTPGKELIISDGHGASDLVGLPLSEDYVFVYNVSGSNNYFVKRIDYERE